MITSTRSLTAACLGFSLAAMLARSLPTGAQTPSMRHSPSLTVTASRRANVSPERLARIDLMLDNAVKSGSIPGAVALVARHGKIVYLKAFGMADNATGRALKSDDIFRIASQT